MPSRRHTGAVKWFATTLGDGRLAGAATEEMNRSRGDPVTPEHVLCETRVKWRQCNIKAYLIQMKAKTHSIKTNYNEFCKQILGESLYKHNVTIWKNV